MQSGSKRPRGPPAASSSAQIRWTATVRMLFETTTSAVFVIETDVIVDGNKIYYFLNERIADSRLKTSFRTENVKILEAPNLK